VAPASLRRPPPNSGAPLAVLWDKVQLLTVNVPPL
jgi:hypothetical protein